jgi:hypothetical protein
VIGYRTGGPEFDSSQVKTFIIHSTVSRLTLEPNQTPILLVPWVLSSEIRRMGHETDHSPACNVEVKTDRAVTPTPTSVHGVINN